MYLYKYKYYYMNFMNIPKKKHVLYLLSMFFPQKKHAKICAKKSPITKALGLKLAPIWASQHSEG